MKETIFIQGIIFIQGKHINSRKTYSFKEIIIIRDNIFVQGNYIQSRKYVHSRKLYSFDNVAFLDIAETFI